MQACLLKEKEKEEGEEDKNNNNAQIKRSSVGRGRGLSDSSTHAIQRERGQQERKETTVFYTAALGQDGWVSRIGGRGPT